MTSLCLYKIQNALLRTFFYSLKKFSPESSAYLIGKIFRYAGPLLPLHRTAQRNLTIAFPAMDKKSAACLEKEIWENLGRTFGELPHLKKRMSQTSIIGKSHLKAALETKRPVIFVSAHFGNWELLPGLLAQEGLPFAPVFRMPNNPYLHLFLLKIRQNILPQATPIFTKGAKDVRPILKHLKSGNHLGMLIDQKMNDGIALRFFNQKAMTSHAAVTFALRTNALLISGRMMRDKRKNPVLIVDAPIDFCKMPHKNDPSFLAAQSQCLNNRIEKWIVKNPAFWLWLHRRWDKSLY